MSESESNSGVAERGNELEIETETSLNENRSHLRRFTLQRTFDIFLSSALLVCSTIPLLSVCYFWWFANRVHEIIGHWPKYMVESVRFPCYSLFDTIAGYFILAVVVSVPAWFALLSVSALRKERKWNALSATLFFVGLGAIFLAFRLDTNRFFEWWLD